ncbi:NAD(P)H-dependent oxidoreductase [Helicobacter sp. 11S02629-2]|uniref:NAD(P)H-dependent oxidoreductase n=1 Tax=Helicobacter sp. 11S02629-2 TaxID=1476195 RepID=UPI000BA678C6|nr:NAD(P)H-dependent oxidoreductase [Helicobacter sp. 11S02629-2]PAF46051.1 hypothetical protein BKH40_01190 [Helicobacter sp. 11S02629-2]
MKTLILLGHPNIEQSVVNKALIASIEGQKDIEVRNIAKLYPDFNIDALKERELLGKADRIVMQFPVYWFNMPTILKQYMDSVFTGILFGETPKLVAGKKFKLMVSTGSPKSKYTKDGRNGFDLEDYLLPERHSAAYLGMEVEETYCVYDTMNIANDASILEKGIKGYKEALNSYPTFS